MIRIVISDEGNEIVMRVMISDEGIEIVMSEAND